MALINIYNGNPTAGATDGVAVSSGNYNNPVSFTLNAANAEAAVQTLAIRCNSGYQTSGNTTLADEGDTLDRVKFGLTASGPWTDKLVLLDTITDVNKLIYVKASSSAEELPQLDRSVSIKVTATVVAV